MQATSSSADVEAELSKARGRLARLQKRQNASSSQLADQAGDQQLLGSSSASDGAPNHSADTIANQNSSSAAAAELFKRARDAEGRLELIGLSRDVVNLVSDTVTKNNAENSGGERSDTTTALAKATESCTSLGLLLLQHQSYCKDERHGQGGNSNGGKKSGQLHSALLQWYHSLHNSTRQMALHVFQTRLRKIAPEYPSNERSSTLIGEALFPSNNSRVRFDDGSELLALAAKSLVELQIVYDALQQQQDQHSHSWRLDIVDELCRPLAERLRFHFLEEQTMIMAGGQQQPPLSSSLEDAQQQSSKMERLPEWLFRYLRDVVENHGVHSSVMVGGVQPLVDSVVDSLLARCALLVAGNDEEGVMGLDDQMQGEGGMRDILQRLRRQRYDHSSIYSLREVGRMARHTLRAKSFFHHPDVVGLECRDRSIALRGIEQLFLFDSFLEERAKEGREYGSSSGSMSISSVVLPPRMVDTFLSSNEFLLQWWLEEERDVMISALHQCASATLSSYQDTDEDDGSNQEMEQATHGATTNQRQLYPPISELFVALLHSARCKSNAFLNGRCRQMYIGNVIAPLCSEYLDMVHAEASWLRRALIARPVVSTTSASGVNVLRSVVLPSDELLISNTMEWASLITGTHLSAQAVLLRSGNEGNLPEDGNSHLLDRVGESMERLCGAMVEDFTSAFVETIIMERAKLASYIMRAPFLLSEPPRDSPGRRGQRDKDQNGNTLSLSPDLNDTVHAMSICVQACNSIMLKLRNTFESSVDQGIEPSNIEPSTMLYFGSRSILDALKFAIGQKLLDIAIDPQGMTPELYLAGALQFQHDVTAFDSLFQLGGLGEGGGVAANIEHGPMERVVTASRLLSLESAQLQAIREALNALAVPSSSIGSIFGRGDESTEQYSVDDEVVNRRLNVDDFYRDARLLEEAINMLEAKGFGALSLDEALSIINRRC